MFLKILVAVVVISGLWMLFFRSARSSVQPQRDNRGSAEPRNRRTKAKDLVKCDRCGVYLPADRPCDCSEGA